MSAPTHDRYTAGSAAVVWTLAVNAGSILLGVSILLGAQLIKGCVQECVGLEERGSVLYWSLDWTCVGPAPERSGAGAVQAFIKRWRSGAGVNINGIHGVNRVNRPH